MRDTLESDEAALETGLDALALLARLLGIPVDAERVRARLGGDIRPRSPRELDAAARTFGIRLRWGRGWNALRRAEQPALAPLTDGAFIVVGRVDAERVLLQDPRRSAPAVLPRARFESLWTGGFAVARRVRPDGESARTGLAWFAPSILRERRALAEVLIASFLLQMFALVTPLLVQVLIDKALPHRAEAILHVVGAGMILVALFEAALGGARALLLAGATSRIDADLGGRLVRRLLRLPLAYFEARRVGDTVARVRELEAIRQFLTGAPLTLLLDGVFALTVLAVMALYSPALTAAVAASLPLYGALSLAVTPVFRARVGEKAQRGAENHAFLVEAVRGIETIKAGALEARTARRWDERLSDYVASSYRTVTLAAAASETAAVVNKITTAAIIWIGAGFAMSGRLSVGELVAFHMLAGRVTGPILRLMQTWHEYQQAAVSVDRLSDVLRAAPEPARGHASFPARCAGRVRLEDVSFRYRPDGADVLRGVTLDIAPGERFGIVGRSGSGKSTIAKLVQRLYVPRNGQIRIDDIDLSAIDPFWLRRQIGVVSQESFLFAGTVRENIAIADPALPVERVVAAASLAGAHDFIAAMPEGYETELGENGVALSGGQRQRIAIARALVTDPRILIFDEATSALDYESEAAIQRNFARICEGRSVIIIAHRLSALRAVHRIAVIDAGAVAEVGAHDELLRRRGLYARLFALQLGAAAPPAGAPAPPAAGPAPAAGAAPPS